MPKRLVNLAVAARSATSTSTIDAKTFSIFLIGIFYCQG